MTTLDGAFSPAARQIIYGVCEGTCIGCGRSDLSAQHRRARGMGGTSLEEISHPANGVPLCGGSLAGVRGCHGWAERHPRIAALLGWRLDPGQPALGTPFWTRVWGWRRWVMVADRPHHEFVDPDTDLDQLADRLIAITTFRAARLTKTRKAAS